jgi:hypothetical protein
MIRSLYRPVAGELRTDLKPHEFLAALQDEGGLLWVDLEDEPADGCEAILRDIFAFILSPSRTRFTSHTSRKLTTGRSICALSYTQSHSNHPQVPGRRPGREVSTQWSSIYSWGLNTS